MESQTPYDVAANHRDNLLENVTIPDNWWILDDDYPFEESVPDDFPEDYEPQYEVMGFTDGVQYIGVWWLRDGERFQLYYDADDCADWSDVYDIDGVAEELADSME